MRSDRSRSQNGSGLGVLGSAGKMAMGVAVGSGLCFDQRESRDGEVFSGFSFQRKGDCGSTGT